MTIRQSLIVLSLVFIILLPVITSCQDNYAEHWEVIRTIQKANDVVYTQEALKALKAGKKKKKKKK